MKTMQDYIVYCTPEQTKRAYKLGAPLKESIAQENVIYLKNPHTLTGMGYYDIPTTQQMIGWLREIGIKFWYGNNPYEWLVSYNKQSVSGFSDDFNELEYDIINNALDYLEKGE